MLRMRSTPLSITCYIKGCKGSHVRLQIPIPGACI